MSSLGSRQDILKARERIEQHFKHCSQHYGTNKEGSRNFSPTWTYEFSDDNMDLVIQFHDSTVIRGVANALMRLIERHGNEELQRVGVACHGSVPYIQEIEEAASRCSIPVNSGEHGIYQGVTNDNTHLGETSPLDMSRLDIGAQLNPVSPTILPMTQAIPFPPYDDLDIVHGQGTVALEFERETSTGIQMASSHRLGDKSRPDIIIGDFDGGVMLSGICMAFVGTGTRVFGAAPTSGFWDHVWKSNTTPISAVDDTSSYLDAQGNRYWADIKHPISETLWSTFTAPGHLSGVFEVNNEQVQAASILARDNYQLQLEPDEAVPLAVALYNEDFQRFIIKESRKRRKLVVGIVLRSRKATR